MKIKIKKRKRNMTVTIVTVALMKSYRCDYKGQADHKSDNWTFKFRDFIFSCLLVFDNNGYIFTRCTPSGLCFCQC